MPLPRAYLIDSSIYIFRAWYVYDKHITDSEGRPVNAVLGFGDFLWQILRQKQPELIACAFDASQVNSYRRELFPAYKANREPAPPDLKYQFALCRELCQAVGIAEFASDRYEADDIIGSLARLLKARGYAITVVSADKDLTQLITGEEDAWWDFARGTVLNHRGIEQHFGVRPEQIADMLAISGDKVDNIPGVPGIGYKMAAKLLQKYPCVDSLLDNLDQVGLMKFRGATRIQRLLQEHRHLLPLNKLLTTIVSDMMDNHGDLRPQGINDDIFERFSTSVSMNSLIQQRWRDLSLN